MSTVFAHIDWGFVAIGGALYAFFQILLRILWKKANSAPLTDLVTGLVFLVGGIPVLVLFHASPSITEILATVWIGEIIASLFMVLWSRRTPRSTTPAGPDQTPQLDSPR